MKNLLPTTLMLFTLAITACNNQGSTKKVMLNASIVNNNSVLLDQTEFDSLLNDFANRFPVSTFGGILSKDSLNNLLTNMPEDSTAVNYIFCIDTNFNKTSLAFRSSAKFENDTNLICYRNSRIEDSFCPYNCNLDCPTLNGTININYNTYKSLYASYANTYSSNTHGGQFDKVTISAILNSISYTKDNVCFRFYYNAEFDKVGIILVGGEDESGNKLYYRNGTSAESFCPYNCAN